MTAPAATGAQPRTKSRPVRYALGDDEEICPACCGSGEDSYRRQCPTCLGFATVPKETGRR